MLLLSLGARRSIGQRPLKPQRKALVKESECRSLPSSASACAARPLIASGEFPPGSPLPAGRELAASFGVSRTSVREAIISLEMNGLFEVRVAKVRG